MTLLTFSTSSENFELIEPAHVDDEAIKSNLERQITALDNPQATSSSTPCKLSRRRGWYKKRAVGCDFCFTCVIGSCDWFVVVV